MSSYARPNRDFLRCLKCGGEVRVIDSRPHSIGSICRRRRCLECQNEVRTFEVTADDYFRVFPESKPMLKVQTRPKRKYVRKSKRKTPVKPKPKPIEITADWKMPDAAIELLNRVGKRYENLPV